MKLFLLLATLLVSFTGLANAKDWGRRGAPINLVGISHFGYKLASSDVITSWNDTVLVSYWHNNESNKNIRCFEKVKIDYSITETNCYQLETGDLK